MRRPLDESKLLDAIGNVCRNREFTHVMLAKHTYGVYVSKLNDDARRRGMRVTTCHNVALLPQEWLPANTIIGFNYRAKDSDICDEIRELMRAIRYETVANIESITLALCEKVSKKKSKQFRASRLPEVKE